MGVKILLVIAWCENAPALPLTPGRKGPETQDGLYQCKLSNDRVDPNLPYLVERASPHATWQVSADSAKDFVTPEDIRIAPAWKLLETLV